MTGNKPEDVLAQLEEQAAQLIAALAAYRVSLMEPPRETARERAHKRWGLLLPVAFIAGWLWRHKAAVGLSLAAAASGAVVWVLVQHGPADEDAGPSPTVTFTKSGRYRYLTPTVTVTRTAGAAATRPAATHGGETISPRPTGSGRPPVMVHPTRTRPGTPPETHSPPPTTAEPTPTHTRPPHTPRPHKSCVKVKVGKLLRLRLLCR